jgi:hypothetical protein
MTKSRQGDIVHGKKVLFLVLLVVVSVVFMASCKLFTAEDRAEVLTQQNCLRGCIDRCPPQMERYGECATRCGQICTVAGQQQQSR